MPISSYIEGLRAKVGDELLLLPSVAVLPRDDSGRILLVRDCATRRWQTIGGAIDPDERPEDAARREALEETGVHLRLGSLLDAVGGPEYRYTYLNGDRCAYVTIVYDATLQSGEPVPDGEETCEVGWWHPAELAGIELGPHATALFGRLGLLGTPTSA